MTDKMAEKKDIEKPQKIKKDLFSIQKKQYLEKLYKPDKSKKGNVDIQISKLIDTINSDANMFTTSSCSGRIVLITTAKSGKKYDTEWIYSTHDLADKEQAWKSMIEYRDNADRLKTSRNKLKHDTFDDKKEDVWLRCEAAIIHVCSRDIKTAQDFMDKTMVVGFKRTGIRSTSKRLIIESMGVDSLDVPIFMNEKLLVEKNYFDILIDESNKKMEKNWERLEKLQKLLNN